MVSSASAIIDWPLLTHLPFYLRNSFYSGFSYIILKLINSLAWAHLCWVLMLIVFRRCHLAYTGVPLCHSGAALMASCCILFSLVIWASEGLNRWSPYSSFDVTISLVHAMLLIRSTVGVHVCWCFHCYLSCLSVHNHLVNVMLENWHLSLLCWKKNDTCQI